MQVRCHLLLLHRSVEQGVALLWPSGWHTCFWIHSGTDCYQETRTLTISSRVPPCFYVHAQKMCKRIWEGTSCTISKACFLPPQPEYSNIGLVCSSQTVVNKRVECLFRIDEQIILFVEKGIVLNRNLL